ncbi:unnamed protein product [Closterium sp. NIES-54]
MPSTIAPRFNASPHPPPRPNLPPLRVPFARPCGSLSRHSPPRRLLLFVTGHDTSHTLILFSLSIISPHFLLSLSYRFLLPFLPSILPFSCSHLPMHCHAVQRSLDQLEALSQQLRARTLLAREGINAEQLTKDLRSVHLKTTFEDVLPVDAGSVEEYLTQVHETSLVMAVQAAVRENTASFDSFMARAIQDDWQRDKRDLLHGLTRLNPSSFPSSFSTGAAGSAGAGTVAAAAGGIAGTPGKAQQRFLSAMSPRSAAAASPAAAAGFASPGGGGRAVGEAREVAYAQVVGELNAAAEQGVVVKVATAMAAAYERATGGEVRGEEQQSVGTRQIWQLVQSLLGEDEQQQQSGPSLSQSPSSSAGGSFLRGDRMGMVMGARRHLEKGHAQYMLNVIQSHPNEASLGGSTGSLHRVRAFLRVRLRDQGPLDFDATPTTRLPPLDTTWHQIFYCLRSGYTNDALHVAQTSRSARAFAPLLATWLSSNGSIDPATSAAAADECDRMARTASHSSLSRPGASFTGAAAGGAAGGVDRRKFLLYVLISGRKALADRLLREAPSLFPTIEDFMWFHLAILRQTDPSPRSQASPSGLSFSGRDGSGWMGGFGGASGANAASASAAAAANSGVYCTLENLQAYLSRFDPSFPDRSSLAEQQVAFRQLESIFHFYLDYAASRLPSALQHLSGLPFLPFAGRSPVACAAVLPSLHRAVEDRLPKLLEDVLSCLDRLPDADPNVRALRNNVSCWGEGWVGKGREKGGGEGGKRKDGRWFGFQLLCLFPRAYTWSPLSPVSPRFPCLYLAVLPLSPQPLPFPLIKAYIVSI